MYDYAELYGNKNYSEYLQIEDFNSLFLNLPNTEKRSNASFFWKVEEYMIRIQGIECDSNGNYSFNADSHFKRLNLIEFSLPEYFDYSHEEAVCAFISEIAEKIGWEVNWRD